MSETKSNGKSYVLNASDCIEIKMGDDPKTSGSPGDAVGRAPQDRVPAPERARVPRDATARMPSGRTTPLKQPGLHVEQVLQLVHGFAALVKCGFTPYAACNVRVQLTSGSSLIWAA